MNDKAAVPPKSKISERCILAPIACAVSSGIPPCGAAGQALRASCRCRPRRFSLPVASRQRMGAVVRWMSSSVGTPLLGALASVERAGVVQRELGCSDGGEENPKQLRTHSLFSAMGHRSILSRDQPIPSKVLHLLHAPPEYFGFLCYHSLN